MKRLTILLAGAAMCSLPAASALADCRAELANLTADSTTTAAISSTAGTDSSGGSAAQGQTTNFETGKTTGGAATNSGQSAEISKDGSLAPLESADQAKTQKSASGDAGMKDDMSKDSASVQGETTGQNATAGQGKIAEDGKTMPMAKSEGGGQPDVAMSGDDAASQQSGQQTAAAESGQGTGETDNTSSQMASTSSGSYDEAVKRAQTALDSGDETACLAAVEEAKGMQGERATQ